METFSNSAGVKPPNAVRTACLKVSISGVPGGTSRNRAMVSGPYSSCTTTSSLVGK